MTPRRVKTLLILSVAIVLAIAVDAYIAARPSVIGRTGSQASTTPSTLIAPPPTTIPSFGSGSASTSGLSVRVQGNALVNGEGQEFRLLGVDASGTEDACVLHSSTISWGPFDQAEADEIGAWHATAVRVPLNEDCWLGINGAPDDYSAAVYRAGITAWVRELNDAGLIVILDLHWSAPGGIQADQQWPMPDADHAVTFWRDVSRTFVDDRAIVFDLFNEPYLGGAHPTAADWQCWQSGCTSSHSYCPHNSACRLVDYQVAGMQQLVDAVRTSGARQPIMLGGLNWAGDPCGIRDAVPSSCAWLRFEPHDPDSQLVDSFHTYDWTACATTSCWDTSVLPVAQSVPVVTSEVGEDDCTTSYVNRYMDWADEAGISYLAWSYNATRPTDSSCAANNLLLLASWSGAPNVDPGIGQVVLDHLAKGANGA